MYSGVKNIFCSVVQSLRISCFLLIQCEHPHGNPSLHFSQSVQFDKGLYFADGHFDNLIFCPLKSLSISIKLDGEK